MKETKDEQQQKKLRKGRSRLSVLLPTIPQEKTKDYEELLEDDADPVAELAEARQLMMQITEEEEGPTSARLGREMLTDIAAHEDVEKPHGEKGHGHGHGGGSAQAAVMIWLGILIDAVPESLVIGILWVSKGLGGMLPFLIGVFLSNLPEAMSSSGTMRASGMRVPTIYLMWTGIVIVTGVGAGIGPPYFPPETKAREKSWP
mmetsp:Transcript_48971/g.122730  ORF Transcript_48971/g.122730 Transcript_48971/m.122730 type:complete len:203 (+) Transcript_48971:179-787(+)